MEILFTLVIYCFSDYITIAAFLLEVKALRLQLRGVSVRLIRGRPALCGVSVCVCDVGVPSPSKASVCV